MLSTFCLTIRVMYHALSTLLIQFRAGIFQEGNVSHKIVSRKCVKNINENKRVINVCRVNVAKFEMLYEKIRGFQFRKSSPLNNMNSKV